MFRIRVLTTSILRSWLALVSATGRRSFAVASTAAETPRVLLVAAGTEKSGRVGKEEEAYWMRDPKTGDWIPENRFTEIDAAELRAQLLPQKIT